MLLEVGGALDDRPPAGPSPRAASFRAPPRPLRGRAVSARRALSARRAVSARRVVVPAVAASRRFTAAPSARLSSAVSLLVSPC